MRARSVEDEVTEEIVVDEDEEATAEEAPVAGVDYEVGEAPIILPGAWVRLGIAEGIPDEVVGHLAWVTDAPVERHQGSEVGLSPRDYETQPWDAKFNVQTRDQYGYVLSGLTRNDFTEVSNAGRVDITNHG